MTFPRRLFNKKINDEAVEVQRDGDIIILKVTKRGLRTHEITFDNGEAYGKFIYSHTSYSDWFYNKDKVITNLIKAIKKRKGMKWENTD